MLYSIIDIGSNTVKLAVLDEEKLFTQAPVFFKAVPLALRSKVADGRLTQDAIEELCQLLEQFLGISKRLTPTVPIAFATASLRGLLNADAIVDTVLKRLGIKIEIITGETEALFSFLGSRGSFPVKAGVTVDLGGGSTEILAFRKNTVVDSVSLPFGCLTLYHRFFEGEHYDFDGCCQFIREHLKKSAPKRPGNSILLSGGSAKAILKYKNILENKKSYTVGTAQFRRIRRHYESDQTEEKEKIAGLLKERFCLVPPALAVFSQIAAHYQRDQVFICRCGVREGCLYHHLKQKEKN